MENYILRDEHTEFSRRLEEENVRQNKRIAELEESVKQISSLVTSVERLANNMEHMAKEQEKQGERLEALEKRDGEMWRKVVGYLITALCSLVLGYLFSQLGLSG